MKNFKKEYLNIERTLKIIYALSAVSVVLLEIFFVLALLAANRFLELALVNIGGIVVTAFVNYSLQRILRKNPSLRMYIREELWILIAVIVITSYGVRDPLGITVTNIFTLTGPSLLVGASFLMFQVSLSAFNKIRRWETIGIRSTEMSNLLSKLDQTFQGKEHQEISSAYRNAEYLPLLFVTEQVNLILTLVSGIFDKLIDESFQILNILIPKDEHGREPGYVKKATYLGLNLSLDDSKFNFDRFWGIRSKYTHHTMDKATEIVPSEVEIEDSIKLLSKTLREYPSIIDNFDSAHTSW